MLESPYRRSSDDDRTVVVSDATVYIYIHSDNAFSAENQQERIGW